MVSSRLNGYCNIYFVDTPADIEKIEIKGHPEDSSKWIHQFTLEYSNSSVELVPYNNSMAVSNISNKYVLFAKQVTNKRENEQINE